MDHTLKSVAKRAAQPRSSHRTIAFKLGTSFAVAFALASGTASAAPSQQTIFNFTNGAEGGKPQSSLIMDKSGALYGTTTIGGNDSACFRVPGCGVVFKMTPPQPGQTSATETVLDSFGGGADGSAPVAGLLMDSSGALYGTTSQGGAGGYGVVFKLTPPAPGQTAWTETTLYSFTGGHDGGTPLGPLAQDFTGALYGTTEFGGTHGLGVVFRLQPPKGHGTVWRETVVHQFRGQADGGAPVAGVAIDAAGTLYGSTPGYGAHGFGVAFSLTRPLHEGDKWTLAVLHAFTNGNDGSYPRGTFIMDKHGWLYGTTSNMGPNATGLGVVFRLVQRRGTESTRREEVLFDFNGFQSTAAHPVGALARDASGALYGTSPTGGAGQMGVLFKLTAPSGGHGLWTESEPDQFFGNGNDGAQPMGGVVVDRNGTLFGTTYVGGKYFYGAMFEVTQ